MDVGDVVSTGDLLSTSPEALQYDSEWSDSKTSERTVNIIELKKENIKRRPGEGSRH